MFLKGDYTMAKKVNKRANGMGTIFHVKDRKLRKPWKVISPAIEKDGKKKRIVIGYARTYEEAERLLNRETKGYTTNLDDWYNLNLDGLYRRFIEARTEEKINKKKISKQQLDNYYYAFLALESLHKKPVRLITIDEWQRIIDDKVKEGYSKSYIKKIRTIISLLYRYGIPRGVGTENLAKYIDINMKDDDKTVRFSKKEIQALKDNIELDYVDVILIMIYTCTRPTELLTARIEKYDRKNNILIAGIKTEQGIDRKIPIHRSIRTLLNKRIGNRCVGNIIIDEKGNEISRHKFYRDFKKVISTLNLNEELTPRSCRKTGSSLMAEADVPDVYRKQIMGHADIEVTNEYYTEIENKKLLEMINKIN